MGARHCSSRCTRGSPIGHGPQGKDERSLWTRGWLFRSVAQLARAPVSKTGGWGFESLHSCHAAARAASGLGGGSEAEARRFRMGCGLVRGGAASRGPGDPGRRASAPRPGPGGRAGEQTCRRPCAGREGRGKRGGSGESEAGGAREASRAREEAKRVARRGQRVARRGQRVAGEERQRTWPRSSR